MTWACTPWAAAPFASASAEALLADAALSDAVVEGIAAVVTIAASGVVITAAADLADVVAESISAAVTIKADVLAVATLADVVDESISATVTVGGAPVAVTADAALVDAVMDNIAAMVLMHNPGDPVMQPGRWIVPVGTRQTPVHLRFDADQIDDLTFRVGPAMLPGESISLVDLLCEAREGDDAGAAQVLLGAYQVSGTDVLQRAQARSVARTYLVRAVVTLNSGRELVGAAFLHVRRQA